MGKLKLRKVAWQWWQMPVILALRRQRQANFWVKG